MSGHHKWSEIKHKKQPKKITILLPWDMKSIMHTLRAATFALWSFSAITWCFIMYNLAPTVSPIAAVFYALCGAGAWACAIYTGSKL